MKIVATFASFIVYTRTLLKTQKSTKVSTFFFISDEHGVKQSTKSRLQNNIYKKSIYYVEFMYNDFKDIRYCR